MIKRIISATIGNNTSAVTTSASYGDLFWIIGDSIAQGSNNTTGAGPDASPNTYFRTSDNTFQTLSTDLPAASNGSPWPQFANEYLASTGIKAAIIPNGVGGSKFFGDWNGTSGTYTGARQDAIDAMSVAGVTRLKGIIIICGVNDARGGDSLVLINESISNLFYQLDTDFPKTQIYIVMLGHATTNPQRLAPVRWYLRNQVFNYTNVQIVCQLQVIHEWNSGGYYSADALHLNQTGNNLLGTMINRYMQLPTSYNKLARSIVNSYFSDVSSKLAAVESWVVALGSQYKELIGFWYTNCPVKDDIYVDWAMLTVPIDDGFVFSANSFITTNTAQTIRMNISPNVLAVGFTSTDFGIGVATLDRKGAFGTTTKYLVGTSTGSNVLGLAESNTGTLQYFAYDNDITNLGSGGFADNTEYTVTRVGTLKSRIVNGVSQNTVTVAAGAALTSGVEIGGRNTAGVVLELNTEVAYFFWFKASNWNTLTFYNANVALKAAW